MGYEVAGAAGTVGVVGAVGAVGAGVPGLNERPYSACHSAGTFGGVQPGWAWCPWRQR